MQFYSSYFLLTLVLLPALYLFLRGAEKRRLNRSLMFAQQGCFHRLSHGISTRLRVYKHMVLILCVLFLVLALARPQWGKEQKVIKRKGLDVVFLLDISKSMLTGDVKPNRLDRAKLQIKHLTRIFRDNRIGLVVFSSTNFFLCPLTLDYSTFDLFLDLANTGYLPHGGTNLASALHSAIESFVGDEEKYNVVIVFSDGEDHEGRLKEVISRIKKRGVRVYCVGVGTAEGGPIPIERSANGETIFQYDDQGKIVVSKLMPSGLKKVAEAAGGLYFPSSASNSEINLIAKHIMELDKREFESRVMVLKEDQYQIFLLIGFFLLLLETVWSRRKNEGL